MWSLISTAFGFILKLIFGPKDAKIQDIAASNATNQSAVAALEAGNEEMQKGDAARAAVDAKRLRSGNLNKVDPTPGNPLNDSAGDFRV